jgi:hypothetical protein
MVGSVMTDHIGGDPVGHCGNRIAMVLLRTHWEPVKSTMVYDSTFIASHK